MGDDQPRYLARTVGYVDSSAIAMDRLEAIDEEEQVRQTAAARRQREQQQRQQWQQARHHLIDGVRIVRASPMPKKIISTMRVVERAIARVDTELRDPD